MELGGKDVLIAGASKGWCEVKVRKKAGRSASDTHAPGSGGAVDPVAQSISDGADTPLTMAAHDDDCARLNAVVDHSCRSCGRIDINVYDAGIIEPIDRFAGSIPVAWGRTVDVTELCIRLGIRTVRRVSLQQRAATGTNVETGAVTVLQDSGPKALRGGAMPKLAARAGNRRSRGADALFGTDPETVASTKRVAITPSGTSLDHRAGQLARNSSAPAIRAFARACAKVVAACAGGDGSAGRPA